MTQRPHQQANHPASLDSTIIPRKCEKCRTQSDTLKRCAGCAQVWYCSIACQKIDWVSHIFHCNPSRPVTTADYLALAVRMREPPEDRQACLDYGFTKACTPPNTLDLLDLYIVLIEELGVKPRTLNEWKVKGTLVQEIKTIFESVPESMRGYGYPWFLENLYVLDGSPAPGNQFDHTIDAVLRAWKFTGGSPVDTLTQIQAEAPNLPRRRKECLFLCMMLFAGIRPLPLDDVWVTLGFCACRTPQEESSLGVRYRDLIEKCGFSEFCEAYDSSSLLTLILTHGPPVDDPYLEGVLRGSPRSLKSVWYLKQYVYLDDEKPYLHLRPSVGIDFGFLNCKTEAEERELMAVYKRYFEHPDANPISLHEDAMVGRVFEHIRGFMKLKPKRFTRLMKNPYSRLQPGSSVGLGWLDERVRTQAESESSFGV